MKVLVLGSGGREHALCWKISRSPLVDRLFCAPGNGGTGEVADNLDIRSDDFRELYKFAKQEKVDLTVVGPEGPLAAGIVDHFEQGGLRIFGPSARAARLEASKIFAKNIMRKHALPTAEFKIFSKADEAKSYLRQAYYPLVVKADGLAQGKGVTVCQQAADAIEAVERLMVAKEFGDAGVKIVVEEALKGEEVSVLALTDARTILILEDARDHKRLRDGDEGPNTGGMGAFSPSGLIGEPQFRQIESKVLVPIVHAMKKEEHPYRGLLYAGLMLTPTGPRVLEFNVRFGDPECQAVLPRLKSDLVPLLLSTIDGTLEDQQVEWDPRPAVTVVVASAGYPGEVRTGVPITGIEKARGRGEDVLVFHAGTRREPVKGGGGARYFTTGGRVLAVTALGASLGEARRKAYEAVKDVKFEGAHYRQDIALSAKG
jgi:phosphoribosylamine--glycine ligase